MRGWDYFAKHSQEWSEKYPGKYVAVAGSKLLAIGNSHLEVFKLAKKKHPGNKLPLRIFLGMRNSYIYYEVSLY